MMVRRISRAWACGPAIVLALAMACSSPDVSGPTITDPATLPWRISLNTHAVTMSTQAPYDTLQLTAVPRTLDGALLQNGTVTFTSSDSTVRVSQTGLLTARGTQTNVRIIASTLVRGIRISDTTIVNVTATAPGTFDRLQLQVPDGDSTKIAVPNVLSRSFGFPEFKTIQVGALTASGTLIPNAVVSIRVSDALQANVPNANATNLNTVANTNDAGNDIPLAPNITARAGVPVMVYAEATVYGVYHRDSLQIQITPKLLLGYAVRKSTMPGRTTSTYMLSPNAVEVIGVGAIVMWFNLTPGDSLDVVFDDPVAALDDVMFFPTGSGNVDAFPGNENALNEDPTPFVRSRRFMQAGTYRWHSQRMNLSGTIIVQ